MWVLHLLSAGWSATGFVSPAFATCDLSCDADQDGWKVDSPSGSCGTCGGPHDCDDGDGSVNPGAAEDGLDAVDDDCDGSRMVRRDHVSGLVGASGSGMVAVHGTWNGDEVLLQAVPGSAATLTWSPGLSWTTGQAWLQVHLNSNGAAPCSVEERLDGATSWTTVGTLSEGDNAVLLGLQPGQVLTAMRVRCLGTGVASKLDWVVVGNGSTPFPPLTDLDIRYTDMHTPDYGSPPASARASADGAQTPRRTVPTTTTWSWGCGTPTTTG